MICTCFSLWWSCFFFKQKTAYELRISDWSSDVCSSDLNLRLRIDQPPAHPGPRRDRVEDEGFARLGGKAIGGRRVGRSQIGSSDERRVGKEGVRTCRSRWSP